MASKRLSDLLCAFRVAFEIPNRIGTHLHHVAVALPSSTAREARHAPSMPSSARCCGKYEHICQIAVETIGPNVRAGRCIGQLAGETQATAVQRMLPSMT
jgi:hypothetical protein